jgi:hypothetical protein
MWGGTRSASVSVTGADELSASLAGVSQVTGLRSPARRSLAPSLLVQGVPWRHWVVQRWVVLVQAG